MAQALKIIGWVSIIGGLIVGIILGYQTDPIASLIYKTSAKTFQFAVAISWWLSGAISGLVFIAFGRMLDYLESLHYEIDELKRRIPAPVETTTYRSGQNSKASLDNVKGYKMTSMD